MFKYLEKLFINIHNGDTPFTLENVNYIRKISYFLIATIIVPFILGVIMSYIMGIDLEAELELQDFIFVLIIFSISYIFEYGYEIQLDSKGRIYGD
jgi:hypothetical protein